MNRQIIISIGREFGSGGHAIAEIVAKDLGINMYDRNMLDEIAREKGIDVDSLHRFDEKPRNPFLSRSVRGYSSSMEENLACSSFGPRFGAQCPERGREEAGCRRVLASLYWEGPSELPHRRSSSSVVPG